MRKQNARFINITAAWLGLALAACACNQGPEFKGRDGNRYYPKVVADQAFAPARIEKDQLQLDPATGLVEQRVTLQQKPPVESLLRQIERAEQMTDATQGHDASRGDQSFGVSSLGKLDLLVVIDDSNSMADEQGKLKMNLPSLIKDVRNTDWQIAVVTTTSSCLRGGAVIKASDADATAKFAAAIDAGIDGSGDERGIQMARRAFEGKCETGDYAWLRDGSSVAVLFVTDEDNYCDGPTCKDEESAEELSKYLKTKRAADQLRAYALIWSKDPTIDLNRDCRRVLGGEESEGAQYRALVQNATYGLNGLVKSICQAEGGYATTLEAISKDVGRSVRREFDLTNVPDSGTLMITVDGQPFTDYTVTGKRVAVTTIADDATTLRASYAYGLKPRFDRLHLGNTAAAGTMQAWIDDKPLDAAGFNWDDQALDLVFKDPPPDDAQVVVKYRENVALPTRFSLVGLGLNGAPLSVKVGQEAVGFTVDPAQQMLILATAPADGAQIHVMYEPADFKVTRYRASLDVANEPVESIAARDVATGEPLTASLDGGDLVIDAIDVTPGRQVAVTYDLGEAARQLDKTLANEPMKDSVDVQRTDGGSACLANVHVVGRHVSVDCEPTDVGTIVVSYQYIAEVHSSFAVTGLSNTGPQQHWEVWVDDAAVAFTRKDNVVSIDPSLLRPDAKVRVRVTDL